MTLDNLRYFAAAAKYEHIGRAARSIPISVSVVSSAVKQLEEEFECELFVREGKRVRLSSQGQRLFEIARDLLGQADGVKQQLGNTEVTLSGHYRIGASHFLTSRVIAPILTALQARFPALTVDVHSQPTWTLTESILAGKIDFGMGFSPSPHPKLELTEIYRGQSEIVVRKDHPIFKKTAKNHYKLLKDYPATMHIATDKILATRHHPILKALGLDGLISFGFDNDFVALENLRKSDNWSFMVDLVAQDFSKYLRTVPVPRSGDTPYTVQFVRHKSHRIDPVMNEVLALAKEHFKR